MSKLKLNIDSCITPKFKDVPFYSKININNNNYIATQAPTYETLNIFINLLSKESIKLIVMLNTKKDIDLNNFIEYWKIYEECIIAENDNYTVSKLNISKQTIIHIWFKEWQDHKPPHNSYKYLINTIIKMKYISNILVHCSAGIGRTSCTIIIHSSIISNKKYNNKHEIKKDIMLFMKQRNFYYVNKDYINFIWTFITNYKI